MAAGRAAGRDPHVPRGVGCQACSSRPWPRGKLLLPAAAAAE